MLTTSRALAVRNDGTVVAWGSPGTSPGEPPTGLKATAIVVDGHTAYALTTDGRVVAWSSGGAKDLPDEVEDAGSVRAVAPVGVRRMLAILADGSPFAWGGSVPPSVMVSDPVSVVGSGGGEYSAVVDGDGVIHHQHVLGSGESGYVPPSLHGRALAQLALGFHGGGLAIVTKMLRGADPQIGGTPNPGQTLTGIPGTFSGSPVGMTVTSRWLADGQPIPGVSGGTLPLTDALVGKKITYESTATKAGEATVVSTSAPVTVVKPAPPTPRKVASKTKIGKVKVAKKAKKVAVAAKVTASKSPAGKAKVTIAKGKKKIVAKNVKVNAKGKVKLAVKKFNKLVAKKTKAKGKQAKRAHLGTYKVVVKYLGNAQVKPSKAGKKFKVTK